MSIATPPAGQSYTILRIKRKRNEEPLEALVVESRIRKKRSRKGVGLFQYAETVENDAWDDAARQKDMQDKILRLAQENALKADSKEIVPQTLEAPPSPASRISRDESSRRYTIIDTEEQKIPSRRYPTAPPKVYSSKELEEIKNARDFKMYDAVPAGSTPMVQDDPSEMDKFLPMLNDYLKIHDIDPNDSTSATLKKSSASHTNGQIVAPIAAVDDDYVWDVFYHRPATMSEWNAVANVGTVTGLPPSLGDGYDSASDSDEEVDEADEDSNGKSSSTPLCICPPDQREFLAEEYYKNDYPEDERSSGKEYDISLRLISIYKIHSQDEFHEDSEYEDAMNNADDSDF